MRQVHFSIITPSFSFTAVLSYNGMVHILRKPSRRREFGITPSFPSRSETHVDFGEADKLLNEFVKQMYIEKHKLTTSKGLVTQLRWGMRAYHEVKMSDILLFVASIYDVDASVWKKQFSSHDGAMETPSL